MSRYIDADELLKRLNACKYPAEKTTMRQVTYNAAISDACRIVDALPAADVAEVRHGRWENDGHTLACSNCHTINIRGIAWNYCPHCGAKMDEVTE